MQQKQNQKQKQEEEQSIGENNQNETNDSKTFLVTLCFVNSINYA